MSIPKCLNVRLHHGRPWNPEHGGGVLVNALFCLDVGTLPDAFRERLRAADLVVARHHPFRTQW